MLVLCWLLRPLPPPPPPPPLLLLRCRCGLSCGRLPLTLLCGCVDSASAATRESFESSAAVEISVESLQSSEIKLISVWRHGT